MPTKSGDDAVLVGGRRNGARDPWDVSTATLAGHVGGWFLSWKQWSQVKAKTRADLDADSKAMAELGIPGPQLHTDLETLAARVDPDDVNRLSYFWQPIQELQSERLKQQGRSHTRTEGFSRAGPHLPSIQGQHAHDRSSK